jgi:hypothetical protein
MVVIGPRGVRATALFALTFRLGFVGNAGSK